MCVAQAHLSKWEARLRPSFEWTQREEESLGGRPAQQVGLSQPSETMPAFVPSLTMTSQADVPSEP